jgi:hypothetical protein
LWQQFEYYPIYGFVADFIDDETAVAVFAPPVFPKPAIIVRFKPDVSPPSLVVAYTSG